MACSSRVLPLLLALCVVLLPALGAAARPVRFPFVVHGRVFCDTCCAGFETPATTYIQGAKVRVECKDRNYLKLVYSREAVTDSTGSYEVTVDYDHNDQICESVLLSSPLKDCASTIPGRERSRVILTNYNGMTSNNRFANNLGFMKDEPMAGCAQVMKLYKEEDV